MVSIIHGSKGGGGSQHTPTESPDTLHSVQRARIVDALSEGPIKGFVHGISNPLKDTYLNETPVANEDGTFNFTDIVIDSRSGTQNQDPMAQFSNVENEIGVGIELRYGTPWVQALTDLDLTAVRVRLAVPQFQKSDTSTGDITGLTVSYTIEISTDGGAFDEVVSSAFAGKTTTEYDKTHLIPLPDATDTGWVLRITRTTANADSASIADTTNIQSYTEIVDAKLRYPNTALVGIVVDAKQFSQIPSRAYHIYGRIISVPSNYNSTTRAYTGTWDGSFKPAWTDNPAWIFYDLVTHPRYGLGQWITAARVNKWALYEIAQYCDELVPDGKGGQEPRFTCNLYLQAQADAYKVLADLSSIFRGMAYWAGGAIQATADMPGDPGFVYTNSNVLNGQFNYQGSGRKTRVTVALVSWNDPNDFGRAKVTYVPDREGIARYGVRETQIIAVGATSEGQAQRAGLWALYSSRLETETITFQVGLDGHLVAPGKLARIADARRTQNRQGGRISLATDTVVTIDKEPGLIEIGGSLTVMLPSGVSETRTISGIDGRDLTVSEAFSEVPSRESAWVVETASLSAQAVRILSISEPISSGDDSMVFTVTALQHNASKFDAIDNGAMIVVPPTVPVQGGYLAPPSVVSVTSFPRKGATRAIPVLEIGWPRVDGATKYMVQYRRDNGEWSVVHTVGGNRLEIENVLPGAYVAQVAAANKLAESMPTVSDSYTLDDSALTPSIIDDLQTEVHNAADDALAANQELANIASDNILSQGEKPVVIRDTNVITTEQPGIDAQATAFGVTTQKTAYDTAVTALTTYLATLTTPVLWSDLTGDTTIVGTTFRTKFADVYTTRQALLNAIYAAAKSKADAAQSTANAANANAPAVVNPQFSNGLTGWTPDSPIGWYVQTGGSSLPDPIVNTALVHGAGGGAASTSAVFNAGHLPVVPGQQVTVTCCVNEAGVNAGALGYARISWRDANNNELSTSQPDGTAQYPRCGAPGTGTYTRCVTKVIAPAPAGAQYAVAEPTVINHTAGYFLFSNVCMVGQPSSVDELPDGDTYVRAIQLSSNAGAITLDNATFQLPSTALDVVPGWALSGSGASVYLQTSGPAPSVGGQYVVLHSGSGVGAVLLHNRTFSVSPGDKVSVGGILYAASGTAEIAANFYDSSGAFISALSVSTSAAAWLASNSSGTVPSNAAKMVISCNQPYASSFAVFNYVWCSINDVRVAGSGATLGNQLNAPNSLTLNYGGVRSATALTASSSGSVSVNDHTVYMGGTSVHYNAVANAVTGLTVGSTYQIYCHDRGGTGGTKTWYAATSIAAALQQGDDVVIGGQVTIPSSGTSGGGGTSGCPDENAWVLRADPDGLRTDWCVRAKEVEVGHYLRLTDGRIGLVTYSKRKASDRVRVFAEGSGKSLTCSATAPLELAECRDGAYTGECVLAPEAAGRVVRILCDRPCVAAQIDRVDDAGAGYVQHITCQNACFWTGDDPDYLFGHHNMKPG